MTAFSADRAVLFDLDGVIVDSRAQHMAAWEAWAAIHAPHAPDGYFHRSFGLRNDAIIGGVLPGLAPDEFARLAAHKEELFRANARAGRPSSLVALPGVAALLEWLDEQAIARAIVTSTPRENLALVLDTLRLDGRFQALVAEEDASRGKPDPEGFVVAAQRLGVAPGRCVVIEDAPAGLAAAKAAGMEAIGVTTTHASSELDAELVVATLEDPRVRQLIGRR